MNDNWIELSKQSSFASFEERTLYLSNHECWLDTMNLHETSWILFAGQEIHNNEPFGWPRHRLEEI